MMKEIPFWEKLNLTIEEAVAYSNIGENTLREIICNNKRLDFIMFIGKKTLIKRQAFEKWNEKQYVVK